MSVGNCQEPEYLVEWPDLPDPRDPEAPAGARIAIALHVNAWIHIHEKHIRSSLEPWEEMLSEQVCGQLRQMELAGSPDTEAARQAWEAIGKEIRQSLERPLALLYGKGKSGRRRGQVWLLVLPGGATAFVCGRKQKGFLMTCYYPQTACVVTDRSSRWKQVVKMILWRYCPRSADQRSLCLPGPEHSVEVRSEKADYRYGFRFVTPQTWGFLSAASGSPWRGRLEPWEAAGPATGKRPKRHRLRQRGCERENETWCDHP